MLFRCIILVLNETSTPKLLRQSRRRTRRILWSKPQISCPSSSFPSLPFPTVSLSNSMRYGEGEGRRQSAVLSKLYIIKERGLYGEEKAEREKNVPERTERRTRGKKSKDTDTQLTLFDGGGHWDEEAGGRREISFALPNIFAKLGRARRR